MSLAGDVAIGAAERVRRSLGPRAGLLSYRALAGNASDSETRGRAVLAGLACAIELDDEAAAEGLVGLYASVTTGLFEADVRRQVLAMLALSARSGASPPGLGAQARAAGAGRLGGWSLSATGLAALEAERFPRARAAYLHARCLEHTGDSGAPEALRRAEERAAREGASEIVQSARALRAALLYERGDAEAASRVAAGLALRGLSAELALRLAPHGLGSASRFSRSAWLGELAERVAAGDPEVAERALALACAHADRLGLALTPMEEDRLLAAFGRLPDLARAARLSARLEHRRALALAARAGDLDAALRALEAARPSDDRALALGRRAADVVRGRFEPRVALPEGDAAALALTACAALRDADLARAEAALSRLPGALEAAPPGERAPAWEATALGLHCDAAPVQRAALAVVAALLQLAVPIPPPPRGGAGLARACLAAASDEGVELSLSLLRAASSAREVGAAEAYLEAARERGWRAAAAGDRDAALRWLREARRASAQR